jgi:transmembrane sensor
MIEPTDINDVRLDRALDRKWAGMATSEDEALLIRWIAADPSRAAVLDVVPHVARGDSAITASDTARAWASVAERIDADTIRPITSALSSTTRRTDARKDWIRSARFGVGAVAAAVIMTIALRAARAPHELVAPRGQRISTTLPDGSTMTLAAGSRARWPRNLGGLTRDVQLDGEGFFTIAHDAKRPFRVLARNGLIEDVGTRFSVRAWNELSDVEVTVEEGIVAISDTNAIKRLPAVRVHAGQSGRLSRNGRLVVDVASPASLAWVTGTLQFNDTPLTEAVRELERWYDVTIHLDPRLSSRRLSARFEAQPLERLLTPLGLALDAKVVRNGASITLMPR